MMMDEQCITVNKLEVSGGMLPQEIFLKISQSEIASEVMFEPKCY